MAQHPENLEMGGLEINRQIGRQTDNKQASLPHKKLYHENSDATVTQDSYGNKSKTNYVHREKHA